MKIRYIELAEHLRIGGLEKAAADMARYLNEGGVEVVRGDGGIETSGPVDLVHFHGLWSPLHYRLARECCRKNLPVVVSPHGMLEPWAWKHRRWKKWPYFQLLEKRRLRNAASILATADAEANNIKRFFPDSKIDVLTLGIEPDVSPDYEKARKELNWESDERVLVYLSRIHPKKGLKEMMEVLLKMAGKGSLGKVRLMILGDGPKDYEDLCRSLADQLRSHMKVDWIPPQWGLGKWKYLQGADLFCLPTYSENFGIVILEAGIVGTPIFTTTGTPWKHVEEAGFGWVVDPVKEAYEKVLTEFLALPVEELGTKRDALAQWTRDHYAWPNLVDRYRDFYASIIKQAQERP